MKAEKMKTYLIQWLLKGGLNFDKKKDAIALEVRFCRNRRLADMLIISNDLHALEIKGEFDNLVKLSYQIDDYRKTFDRVSVVIAPKHLNKMAILPSEVGIIVLSRTGISIHRKSKSKKRLDKNALLMFFNKNELKTITKIKTISKYSTDELRMIAGNCVPLKQIHQAVLHKLMLKYQRLMKLLQQDIGKNVLTDDLQTLYGEVGRIKQ